MRTAEFERKTNETEVFVSVNIDGVGSHNIDTGIGFLDHMLEQVAVHGLIDLSIKAHGDLHVDAHHIVEDVALALGTAFDRALSDRSGIDRMGAVTVPMDESAANVVIDLSGRPCVVFNAEWNASMIGTLPTSLVEHFYESMAVTLRANIHVRVLYGRDDHHKVEALFKALGRALVEAVRINPRRAGNVPSTKGTLTE